MIPDVMLLQGLDDYDDAEELSEQEAHDLVRMGLTQMCVQEIRAH